MPEEDFDHEKARQDFFKIYYNLPSAERDQPIVIIEEDAYNWKAVKREVEHDTDLAGKLLKKMYKMDIL